MIDDNDIDNVDGQTGPSTNLLNGCGIAVRAHAWLKNNRISNTTNNGIIISQGARNVLLENNTISNAGY